MNTHAATTSSSDAQPRFAILQAPSRDPVPRVNAALQVPTAGQPVDLFIQASRFDADHKVRYRSWLRNRWDWPVCNTPFEQSLAARYCTRLPSVKFLFFLPPCTTLETAPALVIHVCPWLRKRR